MKRVFLFLATNLAVLVLLSIVVQVLGLDRYLQGAGLNLGGLLAFAAVFGFGGALISLAISKWTAKRLMNVQVIAQPRTAAESWLVNTVKQHADRVGIGMPEVGVFDSPEMNAFATGARRDKALVAVSTGLLNGMSQTQAEAVIGHEITHVANGDMVTLALLQGVVNTFVIFLARVIGNIVDRAVLRNEDGRGLGYFVTVIAAEIVLGLFASMIVMWFSRRREFRADTGGARLAGTPNMIGALEVLQSEVRRRQPMGLPQQLQAFGISTGVPQGFKRFFMSHPPLEERIAALRTMPQG
ncbi:MAG TPA: protease HtpX [Steroidobacteraceae bacterium]|nr:protease HtpX [Steroidobacteraceae bacterium]